MLHIIVLAKGYFPEKLQKNAGSSDKVIVIASKDGVIPVSAYQNAAFKNMEVRLLPDVKDINSQEGKSILRLSQAYMIGQLTGNAEKYCIYTDDPLLLKAFPSAGGTVKKKAPSKKEKPKEEKSTPKEGKSGRPAVEKGTAKKVKAEVVTKPKKTAKLPTLAKVKMALGAANSQYGGLVLSTLKASNQITFEMNLRMKLAEAGLESSACKEIAGTMNETFGKLLPAS